jgi:exopolyphosphatase/guanosine-5'-triphosphate,3'-diphosphate pyrophosphatase
MSTPSDNSPLVSAAEALGTAGGASAIEAALALARRCDYEAPHSHHVTRLALALFDELRPLHGCGPAERLWLHCGALLHDIGWEDGHKGHHKTSMAVILAAPELDLPPRERKLVALIARYHRKALPSAQHEVFADLTDEDQARVRLLAGMLRVADGLDRSHLSRVRSLRCAVEADRVIVRCRAVGAAAAERLAAEKKADLIEAVLGRKIAVEIRQAT